MFSSETCADFARGNVSAAKRAALQLMRSCFSSSSTEVVFASLPAQAACSVPDVIDNRVVRLVILYIPLVHDRYMVVRELESRKYSDQPMRVKKKYGSGARTNRLTSYLSE